LISRSDHGAADVAVSVTHGLAEEVDGDKSQYGNEEHDQRVFHERGPFLAATQSDVESVQHCHFLRQTCTHAKAESVVPRWVRRPNLPSSIRLGDTEADGLDGGLGPVTHSELLEDVGQVVFHGLLGDVETLSQFLRCGHAEGELL